MADGKKLAASIALSVAVALGVAVLAIAAAKKADVRFDVSADARFSLDATLTDILDNLQGNVRFVGIWPTNEANAAYIGGIITQRMDSLERLDPRIAFTHIDPDLDQPLMDDFAKEWGEARPMTLYAVREGRQPFRIPLSGATQFFLQRDLGAAIVAMDQDTPVTVSVMQGHGELSPDAEGPDGGAALLRTLELGGYTVRQLDPLSLERSGRIPAKDILVIPGPVGAIGGPGIKAILEHLKDGGRILLFADDRLDPELAKAIRPKGVLIGPGFPSDFPKNLQSIFTSEDPGAPHTLVYSEAFSQGRDGSFHRLLTLGPDFFPETSTRINAQALRSGRAVSSPRSTSVEVMSAARLAPVLPEAADLFTQAGTPAINVADALFAMPPESAWIQYPAPTQSKPQDPRALSQPVPLAAAIEWAPDALSAGGDRPARMVVWGSRQAASDNVLLTGRFANDVLILDMMAWLSDRQQSLPIPETRYAEYTVAASDGTVKLIGAIMVIIVPCLFLGGAILMWWDRRKTH